MAKKEQSEKLDKLSKEINALEKQKQGLCLFQSASYAIIIANSVASYCKKYLIV